MKYVLETDASPNGEMFAYTLYVQRNPFKDGDGKNWRHLYVTDRKGNARPFITGDVEISYILWTPVSRFISYLAKDDNDKKALYKIPVDGGESQLVVKFKSDITDYVWGSDGRKVIFLAKDTLPAATDSLEYLGFDQEIHEEDWRPVKVWIYNPDEFQGRPQALDLPGSA